MNPYLTAPEEIPQSDLYWDLPLYGRYCPKADDFRVERRHINSRTTESLQYWASVVNRCDELVKIFPADEGGRDVFALGSIIVKSSHLRATGDSPRAATDYSYADANEIEAIALAKTVLKEIRLPEIYFAGKINGRQVIVQERLPGVALAVAWPYLSPEQKVSFKGQARDILRRLHTIKPPSSKGDGSRTRSYVVPDPNILNNGRIRPVEAEILFSAANHDPDLGFMHNDLSQSNTIVNDGKIVGLIDWEMAGFFGWKTAGAVHRRIRSFQRDDFDKANLSKERLQDILFWNDLYDEDVLPQGCR